MIIWRIRSFGFFYPLELQTDGGVEFAASSPGSFKRNYKNIYEHFEVTRRVIRKNHPEDNAFVERSHRTDGEEFYVPYLLCNKKREESSQKSYPVEAHL